MQNKPNHYHYSGIDPNTVTKAWTAHLDGYSGYCLGQVIKYICRYKFKGDSESLEKARDFLDELIQHTRNQEEVEAMKVPTPITEAEEAFLSSFNK